MHTIVVVSELKYNSLSSFQGQFECDFFFFVIQVFAWKNVFCLVDGTVYSDDIIYIANDFDCNFSRYIFVSIGNAWIDSFTFFFSNCVWLSSQSDFIVNIVRERKCCNGEANCRLYS